MPRLLPRTRGELWHAWRTRCVSRGRRVGAVEVLGQGRLMGRSVRVPLLAVTVLAAAFALPPCASAQSFQLQSLETKDLQVLYTPDNAYLVPHVARSFENSV